MRDALTAGSRRAVPELIATVHRRSLGGTMTEGMSASRSNETEDRAIDPSLHGQVYFQGALDGACFLYAVANAYKALATKKVSTTRWHAAVAHAPDPAGFLGATGATQLGHSEAQRLM
jgi:hypothetical protein